MTIRATRFAVIPEWVLDKASPGAIKLYGVLFRYADQEGRFPSQRVLAERMQLTDRHVRNLLSELTAIGALEDAPGQPSGRYILVAEDPVLRQSTSAVEAKPKRKEDVVWGALVQAYGPAPISPRLRGGWNVAAKELKDQGALPHQIGHRVNALRGTEREWMVVTPLALAKHWGLPLDRGQPDQAARLAAMANGMRSADETQRSPRDPGVPARRVPRTP
jgi:hypothetical protein